MASDDFNRTNANPLDGSWNTSTAWGNLKLATNAVTIVTASSDSAMVHSTSTATDSQVKLTTTDTLTVAGPALHMSTTAGDGYALLFNLGFWHVYELPGFSSLGSWFATPSLANNDVARLRRGAGDTLIASINGTDRVTTAATTTFLSGKPGIFIYDGTTVMDDWTDGVAAAAADTTTVIMPQMVPTGWGRR